MNEKNICAFSANKRKKHSIYNLSTINISRNERAFTLIEIMVAMLVLIAAVVPVAALMTKNAKDTNVSEATLSMMHQSTRILDTLLERTLYKDIIAAAKLNGLKSDTDTSEVITIPNLLDIKDSTTTDKLPVFDKELNFNGPGNTTGKTWQYAEVSRQFEPIVYTLKIKQLDKHFKYLKNKKVVTQLGDIPSYEKPGLADVGYVETQAKLMKITLLVEWGVPRSTEGNKTFQNSYSIVTFKAKLED